MNKQKYLIIFIVLFLGLGFCIYQYLETFKTEVASATSTVPNPGHLWSSMECNSDTLCVDTVNNRLGIGTASPAAKIDIVGSLRLASSSTYKRFINVASYEAQGFTKTGTIVIKVGRTSTHFMSKIRISGWSYTKSWDVTVSGYAQPTQWYHTGNVVITGNPPFSASDVRLITDASSNQYILLGKTTTSHNYYTMIGVDAEETYNNALNSAGWTIDITTTEPVAASTVTPVVSLFGGTSVIPGYLGIGTATPGYALTVAGTAWVTSGSWSGSDARWKKNVSTLSTTSSLDKILALNPVNYEWKTDEYPEMKFSKDAQLGFIAQDVENIIPEVVTTDNNGYKGISYEKIVPVLTSAVQEQQKEIKNLSDENKSLKELVCLDHPLADTCK
ncbi:MAG: tail fiber domain-containing protein [Candidatus Paceibacterota bacterium]